LKGGGSAERTEGLVCLKTTLGVPLLLPLSRKSEVIYRSVLPTDGISDVRYIYVLAYIKPIAVLLWVESHSSLHSLMGKMRLLPCEVQERGKFKRCFVTCTRDNISSNSEI
jgi:hypothetical protein